MGFVPFIRILLRNQRSNKAATFGSMFGVLISIAFITGSFMTSDAIVSDLFKDQIEDVEYHFKAYNYQWDGWWVGDQTEEHLDMMKDARELEGIEDAGLFKKLYGLNFERNEIGVFGLDEGAKRFVFGSDEVQLSEDENSCVITSFMAEDQGLSIGDSINISFSEWLEVPVDEENLTRSSPVIIMKDVDEPYFDPGYYQSVEVIHNFTLNITGIVDDQGWSSVASHFYSPPFRIYFSIEGLRELQERINSVEGIPKGNESLVLFKMDPSYFTNIDNAQQTRKEAKLLKKDLEKIVESNDFYLEEDRISEIYENYLFWSITMRVFLVILSLPLFLLCFYLVLVGSRIGMENKVQEISLLKVKGATRGQVFWMLMMESLLHGTFGTIAGIIIGTGLSSLFISIFLGETLGLLRLLPGPTMMLTLLVISTTIVTLIRLRSMNRLSKMDILKAVRGSP
jgi:ABC-type lipoprotein release transport system permease subunit